MPNYMIVDGIHVEFDQEKNILDVVRKAGIELPTLCYYSDLSIYGACRMCVVEDERGRIMASCSTPPKNKMVIQTNTPKLQKYRKMILELLLSAHCRDCTVCEKSGKCKLQDLAYRFGIKSVRFPNTTVKKPMDTSSKAIVRDPGKCILCGDCVRMCNEVQNVGAIDFAYRGSNMIVSPAFERSIAETDCVNCGQCAAVCPTGAITIKNEIDRAWDAIYDPTKRVVVQIAPAVRVALGEEFGLPAGENVMGKIAASLRKMGFDHIYDTNLSADLTVTEEAAEFVKRIKKGQTKEFPLFTSCCPAWVRYMETKHPELMQYVSSCKSPMQMFGAVIKEYYREQDEMDDRQTFMIAIMPCTAKKAEAAREEFIREGVPDIDLVLTTSELCQMIKETGIKFNDQEPEASDMPFSLYSGGGAIFGVTGGVTEAVIRHVMDDKSSVALRELEFIGVRGADEIKECEIEVEGNPIRIAVVSGLNNAETIIQQITNGERHYDFVEVMACPEGCISGAGQPFNLRGGRKMRARGIYRVDKVAQIKRSGENPMVKELYNGILKNRTKDLLHVHYHK